MSFFSEQKIIWLEAFLADRFGVVCNLASKENQLILRLENKENSIIFNNLNLNFHQFGVSKLNCGRWDPSTEGFLNKLDEDLYAPGLIDSKIFEFKDNAIYCCYDILGLVFWCLNRLEEVTNSNLDNHERYYFSLSHAAKYGYIEYPIVDQWLDILEQAISRLDPTVTFKKNKFTTIITHDVDRPSRYLFSNFFSSLRSAMADFIKKKTLIGFYIAIYNIFSRKQIHRLDPYNSFNWLMDLSEKNNLKSHFYFICGGNTKYDADYAIRDRVIQNLIKDIQIRGHEVGIHPSYDCYLNPDKIKSELSSLREVIGEDKTVGGRMHYLRFKYPETLRHLENSGIVYDSTLGYADQIGFRCGTSHEYTPFDPIEEKSLAIKILPLIVMEGTLYHYMGLSLNNETLARVLALKNRCKMFNGKFTVLWHNSELYSLKLKNFYQSVISE
ncbi:polysaccharide deacetylase family protein [Acinetobacter variabilis]|uniref:polysaccharide deacetylase family protein n=1 Tax=Acinetobacter variabilis TaxID=70346 RepID=UPI003D77781A